MDELINISFGTSVATGLQGYAVVFLGLVLLMLVIMLLGAIVRREPKPKQQPPAIEPEAPAEPVEKPIEPMKNEPELYDTDPRDAAMVMAILAYQLGKPLEELHFRSIREIR